jgi:pyruvate formate lyase activating enzyme
MDETIGIVLDIHRCALNDGPGIRTAVFLKGCPLQCQWCHNPESQRLALETDAAGRTYGRTASVAGIMDIVRQDQRFYAASGGGLTLSGGEPLSQPDFALALLEAAKSEGIHTCLDTCGHVPHSLLEKTLPLTDVYHFDYKATGAGLHRRFTGVSGERIRENLDFLLARNAHIILRCPMIPGANDTPGHFRAIAALAQAHEMLTVDILPYHRMGLDKAERLGTATRGFQEPDTTRIDQWRAALIAAGCPQERFQIHIQL